MKSLASVRLEELNNALSKIADQHGRGAQKLEGKNFNFKNLLPDRYKKDDHHTKMYNEETSVKIYRNFLNWLFSSFQIDEMNFRHQCLSELGVGEGAKILITSCGLGEDAFIASKMVGKSGFVHAQDLSEFFTSHAADRCTFENIIFTASDALSLPYKSDYFDGIYHFGGINLFGDMRTAIEEMTRVCKVGGRVVFGDESVALHLRDSDYGKMFMDNNSLWKEGLPLKFLPLFSNDITIKYVLGNCFYLISYTKCLGFPNVDIDVEHIGYKGGSIRKRYYGRLEGIEPLLKVKLYDYAKNNNTSVSRILEDLIRSLGL